MVEISEEKSKNLYERAVVLATPEYKEIKKHLASYQKLYHFSVLEAVSDARQLADLLGMRFAGDVQRMKHNLDAYLKVLFNGSSFDRRLIVEKVCPDCMMPSLVDTAKVGGEEIKKTCSECGFELDGDFGDFTEFNQALDRDVTFAPVSHLNDTDGAGGTFHPNNTREVRDHKGFLFDIVNADNVLFSDFKKEHPDVAEKLALIEGDDCSVTVAFAGSIFYRAGPFVRRCSLSEYHVFCHKDDSLLRKSILVKQLNFKGEFSKEKIYAMSLCKTYGFDSKNGDQAFINTLGIEIEKFKPFVERRSKHVNFHVFVDTLFYVTLCRFDKRKGRVAQLKGNLRISNALVRFFDGIRQLYENDAFEEEEGAALVKALEVKHDAKAIEA